MSGWDADGNAYSSSSKVSYAGEQWPGGDDRGTADYGYSRLVDDLDRAHPPPVASEQQPQERPRRESYRDEAWDPRDRGPRGEAGPMHHRSANRSEHDGSRGGDGRHHRSGRERSSTEQRRDREHRQEAEPMYWSANRGGQEGSGSRGDESRDPRSDRDPHRERRNAEHRDREQAEPPRPATRPNFQHDFDDTAGYRFERRGQDERYVGRTHDDAPRARAAPVVASPTMGQAYGSDPGWHEYAEASPWLPQGDDVYATVSSTGFTRLEMPRNQSYTSGRQEETSAEAIQQQFGNMSLNHRRESASTIDADSAWSSALPQYDPLTTPFSTSPPTSPASSRSPLPLTRHHRRCNPAQAYDGHGYDLAWVDDGRRNGPAEAYDDYQPQPQPHVQLGASASTRHRKRSSISDESLLSSPRALASPGGFSSGSPPPLSPRRRHRQMTWDPMLSRGEMLPSPGDSNASQPGSLYDTRGTTPRKSSRVRESQRDEASSNGSKKRKKDVSPIVEYVDDQCKAHKYRQPREEDPRRP